MKHWFGVFIAVSSLVLLGLANADEYEDTATVTRVGDQAPDFSCKTIDGETFSLSANKGKVVCITFFATWCGPCLSELPALEKSIYARYKENEDVVFIVIGREHSESELKEFRDKKKLALPFAPDPKRAIYSKYATKYIPRNIIVGRDGVVRVAEAGFSLAEIQRFVDTIEAELAKPAPKETTE